MGREARSEDDPIPVGGPIAPENIAQPAEPEDDENGEADEAADV